ncbi:hypothetical protein ScalyP_jg9063 [Parmales sp. scaly parma]|nr:hypothetical protein ScalyP_jg9063 [Parmales sp. scaly parma]
MSPASLIYGFNVYFNLSVFSSAIFGATTTEANAFSFIYLFVYAVGRLVTGLVISPTFTAVNVSRLATLIQVPIFIISGLLVLFGGNSQAVFWIWVVLQSFIGLGLAAFKISISVNVLDRWNMFNFGFVTSLMLFALGVSGFVGSLIGWASLAIVGDVPLGRGEVSDGVENPWNDDVRKAGGAALNFILAFIAMVAYFLNLKMVKVVC